MQTMSQSTGKVVRRKKMEETEEVKIPEIGEKKEDWVKRVQARRHLRSLAERVAGDQLFYRNYYYPGSKQEFSQDHMRTVDRYFPYAEGGPLYVDEPMMPHEEEDCEKKRAAMKRLGLRYLVIKRGMTEVDCAEALV